jgi:ubiquitin C-terminal hydrolase
VKDSSTPTQEKQPSSRKKLSDDLRRAWESVTFPSPLSTPWIRSFFWQLVNQMRCGACNSLSHSSDVLTAIPLSPSHTRSEREHAVSNDVPSCIVKLMSEEPISDWKCEACSFVSDEATPAWRCSRAWRLPRVAVFHVQRFDATGRKNSWGLSIPDEIDLSSFYCRSPEGPTMYRLRSVLSHLGRNSSSGHYTCHRKLDSDLTQEPWAIADDMNVNRVEPSWTHDRNAYMLLYDRVDDDLTPS